MRKIALLLDFAEVPVSMDLGRLREITLRKIREQVDDVYIHSHKKTDDVPQVWFETAHDFLKWCEGLESDTVVVILNAYAALFDTNAFKRMLVEHERSLYDYTYPENLPVGMLPELFTAEVARFILPTLPEAFPMFRRSVRELFESDISSYDTNLFVHPGRLMRYRVDLIPSSFFHYSTLLSLIDNFGEDPGMDVLEEKLLEHPEAVRTFPTYYEIELTTEAEQGGFFSGSLLQSSGEMSKDLLESVLKQIEKLSYNPMVVFGLYGEPFLYSEFDFLMEQIQKYPQIEFVFESRGISFSAERIERVLEIDNVKVIFDVSFSDPKLFEDYKKTRNSLLPFEAYKNLRDGILSLSHSEKIYLQYTRSTINENGILKFYEDWKDFKDRIIIKKPDCLGGRLTPFRVVDLSPVERFGCLHLKHDLIIRFDGRVPLCRQDLSVSQLLGYADDLKQCWQAMNEFYLKQWKQGDWSEPNLCAKCDEWWIFNH